MRKKNRNRCYIHPNRGLSSGHHLLGMIILVWRISFILNGRPEERPRLGGYTQRVTRTIFFCVMAVGGPPELPVPRIYFLWFLQDLGPVWIERGMCIIFWCVEYRHHQTIGNIICWYKSSIRLSFWLTPTTTATIPLLWPSILWKQLRTCDKEHLRRCGKCCRRTERNDESAL